MLNRLTMIFDLSCRSTGLYVHHLLVRCSLCGRIYLGISLRVGLHKRVHADIHPVDTEISVLSVRHSAEILRCREIQGLLRLYHDRAIAIGEQIFLGHFDVHSEKIAE